MDSKILRILPTFLFHNFLKSDQYQSILLDRLQLILLIGVWMESESMLNP